MSRGYWSRPYRGDRLQQHARTMTEMDTQITRLEQKLDLAKKYLGHRGECSTIAGFKCDCGYEEMLKEVSDDKD